jgi:hypothetical protein
MDDEARPAPREEDDPVEQMAQFPAITEHIINPSRRGNPAFYHPCCRAFNKREWKSRKKQPDVMKALCQHLESYRLSSIFEPGKKALSPADVSLQFYNWTIRLGIDHDFNKPFVINQKQCTKKEEIMGPTLRAIEMVVPQPQPRPIGPPDNTLYIQHLKNKIIHLQRQVKRIKKKKENLNKKYKQQKEKWRKSAHVHKVIMDDLAKEVTNLKLKQLKRLYPKPSIQNDSLQRAVSPILKENRNSGSDSSSFSPSASSLN